MKNSKNTIGNRTRDRLACSAVPQQTAPPRASRHISKDKAIPLQARTGPEGSRRLGLPDFKTIVT